MDNRRNFIKKVSIGGALTALGGTTIASVTNSFPAPKTQGVTAKLRLSCQENVAPGATLNEKLDFLEANGFEGFEQGCGGILDRSEEVRKALQNRKIKISVVCAGFNGCLLGDKQEERDLAMKTISEGLVHAGELGAKGMIVVPAFNGQSSMPFVDARKLLIDQLKELAATAAKHNTKIILEPLNRKEAWFLRLVADAAAICRDVDSPGIGCMGDFWHMTWEETSDMGAFLSAGKYLTHVHVASRKNRKTPGEDVGDNYVDGFKGLKMINYPNFVSLECGAVGDKKVVIPAAVKLLKQQWEMA